MEELLREKMNAMENPTLAPMPRRGVQAAHHRQGPTEAEARALIAPVEEELRALFGHKIYGADISSLEEAVFALLRERGFTLAVPRAAPGPDCQAHDRSARFLRRIPGRRGELHQCGQGGSWVCPMPCWRSTGQ